MIAILGGESLIKAVAQMATRHTSASVTSSHFNATANAMPSSLTHFLQKIRIGCGVGQILNEPPLGRSGKQRMILLHHRCADVQLRFSQNVGAFEKRSCKNSTNNELDEQPIPCIRSYPATTTGRMLLSVDTINANQSSPAATLIAALRTAHCIECVLIRKDAFESASAY